MAEEPHFHSLIARDGRRLITRINCSQTLRTKSYSADRVVGAQRELADARLPLSNSTVRLTTRRIPRHPGQPYILGRELITLTLGGIDHAYRVRSVLRCPEARVWLVESQAEPPAFPFDE